MGSGARNRQRNHSEALLHGRMTAGSVLVGERGPEIVTLPTGASVRPHSAGASATLPPFAIEIIDNRPIELEVDGHRLAVAIAQHRPVLGEAVARARLDKGARA
jgi:hypothetical protein